MPSGEGSFTLQNEVSHQWCHSQKIVGSESVNSCSYVYIYIYIDTHIGKQSHHCSVEMLISPVLVLVPWSRPPRGDKT